MNVLVTGANGFIGRALCKKMLADGWQVRGTVRGVTQMTALSSRVEGVKAGDIGPDTDWSKVLNGMDAVVHLAARVHVMNDTASDPIATSRWVNVKGTERLAQQAVDANVRRFFYELYQGKWRKDRSQRAEVRGQEKTEVRGQKSEVAPEE